MTESVIAPNTKFTITLKWTNIAPVYQKLLTKNAKHVKAPGFRAGKVPAHIAEDIIGVEAIKEEVIRQLLPASYQVVITEKKYHPLTQPSVKPVSWNKNEDWNIEVEIAEKPEISLKKYQDLVKKAKKAATEEAAKTEKEPKTDKAAPAKPPTDDEKKENTLQHIYRELVVGIQPAIPELLIREETRYELEQLVKSLRQVNLTLDDYLSKRHTTFDQLSTEMATQVLTRLQLEFILDALIEDLKITAEDKDLQTYFERITDAAAREQQEKDERYRAYLTRLILRQKVGEHLLSL